MNYLTVFNKALMETIFFFCFHFPKQILHTLTFTIMLAYLLCIAVPLYILFGCDVRKELAEVLEGK